MVKKQGYLREELKVFKIKDYTDKEFSFHYHDFYKIIVFVAGDVTYSIEGKNYELNPYDIVLVSESEIHRPIINKNVEYDRYVMYISGSFFKNYPALIECFNKAKEDHTNVMRVSNIDYSKLTELLDKAVGKIKSDEKFGSLYLHTYAMQALLLINESVSSNGLRFEGKVSYDKKMLDVCEYINSHLKEDLSIESLSEKFYISKYYFMHKFKEYTGLTLHHYILEKRLLYTKQLIESGEKATFACVMAGFKDYSTYIRAKKRLNSRFMKDLE